MDIGLAVRTLQVEPVVDPVPRPGAGDAEHRGARPAWLPAPVGRGMSAPDYAEPLVGWRAWTVVTCPEGLTLAAPDTGVIWTARQEISAGCASPAPRLARGLRRRRAHEAPEAGCSCGIRAAADPALAAAELDSAASTAAILGQVYLWGTVIECEGGWRAGRAYPARLFLAAAPERSRRIHRTDWLAHRLAGYGVPVSVLDCRRPGELAAAIAAATPSPRAAPGDP